MQDTPPRTLSYARVSSLAQTEGYSLDAQRDRAADYARFKGWPEPIHFSDAGVSGRRDTRPGLSALLAALRPGDVLLVKDVTRVGRGGALQTLGIIRQIEERGGTVVFIDQNIDTSTPIGRLILTMMAGFSELELEQTRERAMVGRLQAARAGHWPSNSVPYGYRRNAARRLELDPATAPHARAALDALAGRSLREAARHLNAAGIPSSGKGRGKWTVPGLHDLMHNTAYVGRAVFRAGGSHVEVPCPRLADEELWAAIHARPQAEGGSPKRGTYPLTGHVRCPHGAPYTGQIAPTAGAGGTPWRFYFISSQARRRYGCRCGQRGADGLEEEARALLAATLTDPNDPAALRALYDPAEAAPDPHEAERREVRAQLSNLAALQVRGAIELDDYLRLRADLKAQEAALPRAVREPPPAMPPMPEIADAVLTAPPEELAELLDILEVRFTLHGRERLELTRLRPVLDDA